MVAERNRVSEIFRRYPLLSDYPKSFISKDKKEFIIRPMIGEDVEELYKFFSKIDREDRQFLRDDVSKKEVIEKWAENLNYDIVLPLLAFHKGEVVADGTLHASNYFWTRHVAEIRVVVAKDFRNFGLGKKIVSELFFISLKRGFKKIVAQIPFYQHNTIRIFESLGFEKEAILRKHVIIQGKFTDLLIMSIFTDNVVQSMKKSS